jgi:hypothetical protein
MCLPEKNPPLPRHLLVPPPGLRIQTGCGGFSGHRYDFHPPTLGDMNVSTYAHTHTITTLHLNLHQGVQLLYM